MTDHHYIVLGVGGSQAHGLAVEGSDYDGRGVFSYPTEDFFRFTDPKESIVTTGPDSTSHELRKFLRLAAKGNPDVLELFGLDTYAAFDPQWGPRLLDLLPAVLSINVRSAYLGYANQKLTDMLKQGEDFWPQYGTRNWKTAKHFFRILEAGKHVLSTGEIQVRVRDRDFYLEEIPKLMGNEFFHKAYEALEDFQSTNNILNAAPETSRLEQFIIDYRKAH